MSPPFLSPRGEGRRCTICTAFSAMDAGRAFLASPVGVSEFGDQVAALLERIKRERYIKFPPQSRFHADLNIVVIDKHGDVQFFLH